MIKSNFCIDKVLFNIGISNSFLTMTQDPEAQKGKVDKSDYTKKSSWEKMP